MGWGTRLGGGGKLWSQFDQDAFEKVEDLAKITKIAHNTDKLLLSMPYHFGQGCPHETFSCNKEGANFKVTSIVLIAHIAAGFVVVMASYDLNLVQRPKRYCLSKPAVGPP